MTTATNATAAAEPARDLLNGWTHRLTATVVRVPRTGLEGEEVAVATFYTGGLAAPGGRDVRVATAGGELLAHRILQVGPGDRLRVAFALRQGVKQYSIYLGNRRAAAAGEDLRLDIRRGVLMETRAYAGGGLDTLEAVRQTFDRAGAEKLLGRDFRPNVFIGHNPFGPQSAICSRFIGHLRLSKKGRYNFVISSRDASFLLIDSKPVIFNGGRHRPQRGYSKNVTVDLEAGLHRLEMLHVSRGSAPIVVLAWRPEGRGRAVPVPPIAFAPIVRATCGPLQRRGGRVAADFRIKHAAETFLQGRYYQRYVFGERVTESIDGDADFTWDFGDGQTATGATVEHVYLTDGMRKVTLTARTPAGRFVRTHRIQVARDWDRVTRRAVESPRQYGRMVRRYDFQALSAADAAAAAALLGAMGADQEVLTLAEVVVAHGATNSKVHREVFSAAADVYRRAGRSEDAVDLLTRATANAAGTVARGGLEVLTAEVVLTDLRQPDRALEIFERVVADYDQRIHAEWVWRARVGIGNAWRMKGDYTRAQEAYSRVAPPGNHRLRAVSRGRCAFDVEAYIRDEQFELAADVLDRWELALPADRLTGYSTLLGVRLYAATEQYARAVTEAEDLLRVNPGSNYAPNLLLAVAAAQLKLDRPADARAALQRLVDDYPESALAAAAAERLGRTATPAEP